MYNKIKLSKKQVMNTGGMLLYKIFRFILLLGVSYIMLYPILKLLSQSLSLPSDTFGDQGTWIPNTVTLTNYVICVKMYDYWDKLKNTLIVCLPSTAIQLVVCSCVGYGLAKYRSRFSKVVFAMVILTIVFPVQSYYLPLYTQYRDFDFFGIGKLIGMITGKELTANLLDKYLIFYLSAAFGVGLNSGLYIFIFRQFFMGMPKELEEASRVDGCNALATYIRIVVPSSVPVFVTVFLLSIVSYWNDHVGIGNFFTSPEKLTLVSYLGTIASISGTSATELEIRLSTVLLLCQLPLILLYIFGQKFFTECMDRSGIKG